MTMKRLLPTLLALLLVAAACGDDTSVDAGDDGQTPADGTPGGGDDEPIDPDAPIQFGSYPVGELTIEVTNPDGSTMNYTIACLGDTATLTGDWDTAADGPGGTAADAMCNRLADPNVQELLINGLADDLVCTEQYGSAHVARITGTLDGAEVALDVDRADGCGIDAWDRRLAGVLPAVEG